MPENNKAIVIDDAAVCREFLTAMLEDRGYRVEKFDSAAAFVAHCGAEQRCPVSEPCAELLLTDNQMPRMTGLELIEEQLGKGCKLLADHLAVISGCWSEVDLQKAARLGCATFEKPRLNGFDSWLAKYRKDV